MPTIDRSKTLFIGVDVHKETHTAVGLSPFGEKIFEMTIGNERDDFRSLMFRSHTEAKRQKLVPHFGLEDVKSYGERACFISSGRKRACRRDCADTCRSRTQTNSASREV